MLNLERSIVKTEHIVFRKNHANAASMQNAAVHVLAAMRFQHESVSNTVERLRQNAAEAQKCSDPRDRQLCQQHYEKWRNALEVGERLIRDLEAIRADSMWFAPVQEFPDFPDNWEAHLSKIVSLTRDALNDSGISLKKTRGPYLKILQAIIQRTVGGTPPALDTIYQRLPAG